MRRVRLYTAQPLAPEREVVLEAGPAAHLVRVLRRGEGDEVVLFNGDGHDYPARIHSVSRKAVVLRVLSRLPVDKESPLVLHLGQGISRGERMDWVVQKAVELGVAVLTPLLTERVVVRLDASRRARRLQHWQGVMQAACEQCGRARLPRLEAVSSLHAWLQDLEPGALGVFLDPGGELALHELPGEGPSRVRVLIGPEGGLSEDERAAARRAGFLGLRLGPRVLRTETAALAALAVLQARWGDLA